MRILFIIDCFGSGGAQRQMVNLAVGLKNRGHDIEFFIYHPEFSYFKDLVLNNGIKIHEFYKKHRISIKLFSELRRIINNGNYDAILSFLDAPNFYAEIANFGTQCPLVVSLRNMYPKKLKLKHWFLGQVHRFATHITTNSYAQKDSMIKLFPWAENKIYVIYNGVDTNLFKPSDKKVDNNILTLIAIGRISKQKNNINLIKALHYLKESYKISCLIKWAGRIDSKKEFDMANKLLQELGLSNQWIWLGERKDIIEILNSADALIHPSLYEGLPNAICEALACGKPVLASNVCDNSRLVLEGERGLLFDPHDIYDIASAIYKFNNLSASERYKMGKKGREFAVSELSLENFINSYENLFNKIIKIDKKK